MRFALFEASPLFAKTTGLKNGLNGRNGLKRIFPPSADEDEPKASQGPFLSVPSV
jgi:hypothetical protein